jgi:excisionase family DNA binding protein
MEQLLTPEALAAVLGIKKRSVYILRARGGNLPPGIKIGRLLRFRPADVQAWLAKQPASA